VPAYGQEGAGVSLFYVDQDIYRITCLSHLRTGTDGYQAVNFCLHIHVGTRLWFNVRILHTSCFSIDLHCLEKIEGAGNIFGGDLQGFRASVRFSQQPWLGISSYFSSPFHSGRTFRLSTKSPSLATAHPLLEVMGTLFECIFHNGKERCIVFRKKLVSRAYKNFLLHDLRSA